MHIWQPCVRDPYLIEHLTVDARLILGILGCCDDTNPSTISEVMFPKALKEDRRARKVAEIENMIRRLRRCRHPLVQESLELGLPLSASAPLFNTGPKMLCRRCRNYLASVPCALCECARMAVRGGVRLEQLTLDSDCREPMSPSPTQYYPGTREKKIVMKYRLQRGQSVFCAADA